MDLGLDQIGTLGDGELLSGLRELAAGLRVSECRLLVYLSEVEERRLYARQGFPSLFAFAVTILKFAEGAACRRIAAARAARRFPEIYDYLANGSLHVTGVAILAPFLKADTCADILAEASGRTKRELEKLVARLAPKPDAPDFVRRLSAPASAPASGPARAATSLATTYEPVDLAPSPLFASLASGDVMGRVASVAAADVVVRAASADVVARGAAAADPTAGGRSAERTTSGSVAEPSVQPPYLQPQPQTQPQTQSPHPKIHPLSPGRNLFRFTASDATLAKFDRARDLLSHKYPAGKFEDILDEALDILLEHRDPARKIARRKLRNAKKAEHQSRPAPSTKRRRRSRSRYIPVAVKEAAWEESHGRCTFESPDGRRCNSARMLQHDHIHPYALGGSSTDKANIQDLCFTHNALRALDTFGPRAAHCYTTASGGNFSTNTATAAVATNTTVTRAPPAPAPGPRPAGATSEVRAAAR